jgi:hypothetical protein
MRGPDGKPLLLDRATGRTVPVVPGQTPPPPVQLPPSAQIPFAAPQSPGMDAVSDHPQGGVVLDGDGVHGVTRSLRALRDAGIDDTGSFAPLLPALTGHDSMQRAAALRAMPAHYRLRAIGALRAVGVEE